MILLFPIETLFNVLHRNVIVSIKNFATLLYIKEKKS